MALALVRSRHLEHQTDDGWVADPTGDLGRITRQQVFLRRSMDQVRTLGVDDANTLRRLIDVGVESVSIDQALGLSQMVDLGRRFGAVEPEAMRTYSLPADPFTTSGGAAVLRVEEGEAQSILNIFRGLPPDTVFPSQVSNITVLNGTGTDGQAGDVSDALEEVGFDVVGVGDVEAGDGVGDDGGASSVAVTRIRYAPGAERFADLLRRHLTSDAVLIVDETLGDEGIVLETGMDFTTIGREARPADATSSTTSSTAGSSTSEEVGNDDEEPETTTTTDAPGYAPDAESACS
jgi:hypothetical protein